MITLILLIGLALAVLLSGFFSGSETGIYCLDRVRLRVASERNQPGASRLAALMRWPEDVVITMLLGTNVSDYLATAFVAALLLRASVQESLIEVYATAIVTPLVLVFGGIIPKDWFRRESDRLMYTLSLPLTACLRLARATGLLWALRRLTHTLVRWIDPRRQIQEEDVLSGVRTLGLLREGAAGGGLTVLQRDLMDRVIGISKTAVDDVMIPITRVAMVPRSIARDDLLRIARMAHFSRLPVYDDDPRRVVGIVNVYDVLADPRAGSAAGYLREAFRLPSATSVSTALLAMQRAGQAMAVVEDRDGNCLGVLTVKDLVEQIIGDFEAW